MMSTRGGCLGDELDHKPVPLQFGTSGRRGRLVHLTQLEVYLNARAELEYLQSLPAAEGGIRRGEEFYFAYDLRPSSREFVREAQGRGELAQAIERAIRDSGMKPVNLGCIPTPALTYHALQRNKGSIMVTGSHIPFDYNGYKTNRAKGELRKADEGPINRLVEQVRERLYRQPAAQSIFDAQGQFRSGHAELSAAVADGREGYLQRYTDFFAGKSLKGFRLLVYQHSAVGRDLLVELLQGLGAEVIPAGRSDTFVAIDTENMDARRLSEIQALAHEAWVRHGPLDAVVSTDGDSDRPLILSFEEGKEPMAGKVPGRVRFFGGDLAGMVVAEYLAADAVVVPITCNDAIDRGALSKIVEPKTRIGSPYVLAGAAAALAKGRKAVCGWEPNGGFVLASDLLRHGNRLKALPTRDAVLPILGVLFSAMERGASVCSLFDRLPRRFSRATLLKNFPREVGCRIVQRFLPMTEGVREIRFQGARVILLDSAAGEVPPAQDALSEATSIRGALSQFFGRADGFGQLTRINYTDGVRLYFENDDVAHFRPSGNADELRMYAVANSQPRADEIAAAGVAEPDGILRQMERFAGKPT
jgi:phosphomannomutase